MRRAAACSHTTVPSPSSTSTLTRRATTQTARSSRTSWVSCARCARGCRKCGLQVGPSSCAATSTLRGGRRTRRGSWRWYPPQHCATSRLQPRRPHRLRTRRLRMCMLQRRVARPRTGQQPNRRRRSGPTTQRPRRVLRSAPSSSRRWAGRRCQTSSFAVLASPCTRSTRRLSAAPPRVARSQCRPTIDARCSGGWRSRWARRTRRVIPLIGCARSCRTMRWSMRSPACDLMRLVASRAVRSCASICRPQHCHWSHV
mmetsp:Transcript_13818/g.36231  ORF Transcript_13818/g.36231 Transcript_13818/m.36231 type:complete len:257 (+) Transcript_13818:324-1094(+)